MKDTLNFIRECKTFFFSTVNGDEPATRPFGAIMEHNGCFYLTTGRKGNTFLQLKENQNVQIVALLPNTRRWARITGTAVEEVDEKLKIKMIEENPILEKRYSSFKDENLVLIKLTPKKIDKNF